MAKAKQAAQTQLGIKWTDRVVKVSELVPYDKNPRKITVQQYDRLKASLIETGYHTPMLAQPDLRIIGGHQRKKALMELGITEVTVRVPERELTDEEFKRVLIQSNVHFGDWEVDTLLSDHVKGDLINWGMDESIFPVDPVQYSENEDDVPPVPVTPLTVLGDMWILGNHRIICGDSTSADVVGKLLGSVKPHLMVTDPPYGVEYDASWRDDALKGKKGGRATGKVKNDDQADWREAWALFPGSIMYVWHGPTRSHEVAQSLLSCGFKIRSQIIWAKSHFVISRGDYHPQHEPCWYAVKGTGNWTGDRKQSTVWQIDKPQKSETGHSTQKPIECMKRPIENNSSPGQAVYEPFSGSGTTIIAAEQTGRHCYAIELSPAYVDVAVKRWQDFTGQKAVHATTGAEFGASGHT